MRYDSHLQLPLTFNGQSFFSGPPKRFQSLSNCPRSLKTRPALTGGTCATGGQPASGASLWVLDPVMSQVTREASEMTSMLTSGHHPYQ